MRRDFYHQHRKLFALAGGMETKMKKDNFKFSLEEDIQAAEKNETVYEDQHSLLSPEKMVMMNCLLGIAKSLIEIRDELRIMNEMR